LIGEIAVVGNRRVFENAKVFVFEKPGLWRSAREEDSPYFHLVKGRISEAKGDLNGDGQEDIAFLLTSDRGGSGTFYYVQLVPLRTRARSKSTPVDHPGWSPRRSGPPATLYGGIGRLLQCPPSSFERQSYHCPGSSDP
jgi:hypothetical protein